MAKLPVSSPAPVGALKVEVFGQGGFVVAGADNVARYRAIAQRHALALEIVGMKFSRGSVYAQVKKEYGFKGSKKAVLQQLVNYIETNITGKQNND